MKKFFTGFIGLFIVYLIFAIIIRAFHTFGTDTAIIKVTGKGESELINLNKVYKIEFSAIEKEDEINNLYAVQSDYDNLAIGTTYQISITAERCASWLDFFKLFGTYDYKILSVKNVTGSSTKEEVKKIFTDEKSKMNTNVLWALLGFIVLVFLFYKINKKARGSFKLINNKWIANKPAWLEFLNGIWLLLNVLVFGTGLVYSFSNAQYLYLTLSAVFLGLSIISLVKEYTSRNNRIEISDESIVVYSKSKEPNSITNWKDLTSIDEIRGEKGGIKGFDFKMGENKKSIDLAFLNLELFSDELSLKVKEYAEKNAVAINIIKK
jgi:hypothetical protein